MKSGGSAADCAIANGAHDSPCSGRLPARPESIRLSFPPLRWPGSCMDGAAQQGEAGETPSPMI